jgi:hypothetical protein
LAGQREKGGSKTWDRIPEGAAGAKEEYGPENKGCIENSGRLGSLRRNIKNRSYTRQDAAKADRCIEPEANPSAVPAEKNETEVPAAVYLHAEVRPASSLRTLFAYTQRTFEIRDVGEVAERWLKQA